MDKNFVHKLYQSHQSCPTCPAPSEVSAFYVDLIGTLFADFTQMASLSEAEFEGHIANLEKELERILRHNPTRGQANPAKLGEQFFNALPTIHEKLGQDIDAMFEGD